MKTLVNWTEIRVHPELTLPEIPDEIIPTPYSNNPSSNALDLLLDRLAKLPLPFGWRPVSSATGKITCIVIPLRQSPLALGRQLSLSFYCDFIGSHVAHLTDTRLIIFAYSNEEVKAIKACLCQQYSASIINQRVLFIVDDTSTILFQEWPQDQVLAFQFPQEPDAVYLLEQFNSRSDSLADKLQKHLPQILSNKGLVEFDGGNLLTDGEKAIVGYDEVMHTYEKYHKVIPEKEIEQLFAIQLNIKLENIIWIKGELLRHRYPNQSHQGITWKHHLNLWCGSHCQSIYHLDLFLTLAGSDSDGNHYILVGDPWLEQFSPEIETWPSEIKDPFTESIDHLKYQLNEVVELLKAKGFKVIRNPMPITYLDEPVGGMSNRYKRQWFLASYNNAIVQRAIGKNKVLLPSYAHDYSEKGMGYGNWSSLKEAEKRNQEIWQNQLGFDVRFFGDCLPLARFRGGPNCSIKIIHRTK